MTVRVKLSVSNCCSRAHIMVSSIDAVLTRIQISTVDAKLIVPKACI